MLFISLPVKSNKFTGMDLLGGGGKSNRGQSLRGGAGGVLFFMIKQKNIRDKMRTTIIIQIQ
jgi:hypothetical protein